MGINIHCFALQCARSLQAARQHQQQLAPRDAAGWQPERAWRGVLTPSSEGSRLSLKDDGCQQEQQLHQQLDQQQQQQWPASSHPTLTEPWQQQQELSPVRPAAAPDRAAAVRRSGSALQPAAAVRSSMELRSSMERRAASASPERAVRRSLRSSGGGLPHGPQPTRVSVGYLHLPGVLHCFAAWRRTTFDTRPLLDASK
jgi:hypothetical protein